MEKSSRNKNSNNDFNSIDNEIRIKIDSLNKENERLNKEIKKKRYKINLLKKSENKSENKKEKIAKINSNINSFKNKKKNNKELLDFLKDEIKNLNNLKERILNINTSFKRLKLRIDQIELLIWNSERPIYDKLLSRVNGTSSRNYELELKKNKKQNPMRRREIASLEKEQKKLIVEKKSYITELKEKYNIISSLIQ